MNSLKAFNKIINQIQIKPHNGVVHLGRVSRAVGMALEAEGFYPSVGTRCEIDIEDGKKLEAEVVGFHHQKAFLMSLHHLHGIAPGQRIRPIPGQAEIGVGFSLLGRILDGAGRPVDGRGPLFIEHIQPLHAKPINPLHRAVIDTPLDVGVRAINGLLTAGRGQRLGLFAGSGVGKSVLLGMMTKFTKADVVVVGLIGERGREVKEFIESILGEEGLKRAVVVAAAADESPLMRLHGAMVATSIAEFFRDEGKDVLLLMDSLTRYAQAQREIGLSIGEPPATKGYPPSVFAKLPQLVERAGNGEEGGGSITAFYTVLTEGDDQQDPIADAARAILDGHIVLSRELAESGQFPAIHLEASISRVMPSITTQEHLKHMMLLKKYLSLYEKNKDMILLGAYSKGSDPQIDKAILLRDNIRNYVMQSMHESVDYERSVNELMSLTQELQS